MNDIMNDTKNNASVFDFKTIKISDLKKLEKEYVAFKKSQYKALKKIKSQDRNFENTILNLAEGDRSFQDKMSTIGLLLNVHTDKKFREEAVNMMTRLNKTMIDIEYDKEIYDLLIDYHENNFKTEVASGILEECDKKLVEDLVRGYKRMGFALPKVKQDKLKSLMKELGEVENNFSKNLNDYQDFILVKEEDLKEMPEGFISTLEKVTPSPASQDIPKGKQNTTHVQEKTLYKIDLTYPKVGPFLKYSSNRVLKKELADKNNRKGGKISLKYIEKMVKLRVQITKILGYENYVDFKVEERMAKNNVTVQKFLVNAKKEILPAGKKDLKELKDFAKEKLNLKKLEYFDLAYASNKLYESKYSIDEKSVKEYFEMNHTLEFMFKYFGEIFGFEAVEEKDLQKEMWHPEVKVIKLQDSKKKNLLGYLLLDLYPREGKFNHMASFDTKYNTKMNTLVCNFQKPSETSPSLLTPHEVETLFHEFGHALHFLFSNTKHLSQNSFSFAWDIVELPSQMLENFFYNESILSKLSKHYKSGKSLDKKTIEKIISAKNFQNGYVYTRQIVMTELDLDIHLQKVKNKYEEYYKSLVKKYTSLGTGKDSLFPAGFGHLSGYDAGYYSYLWAQIYALDVYDQFAQHITNKTELKKLGRKYREEILEVGTSRKESDSIKAFLGRDVNAKVIKNLFN